MAALVDYTAKTVAQGFEDKFPVAPSTPVSGLNKEYIRKVRVDFSKTNLAMGDWATVMDIPAGTYVKEVFAFVVAAEGAGNILIGDAGTDQDNNWITTTAATLGNFISTIAATAMAAGGKYYSAAGALYLSVSAAFDTAIIDIYAKCINIDQS